MNKNIKVLGLIATFSLIVIGCGDDDSPTDPSSWLDSEMDALGTVDLGGFTVPGTYPETNATTGALAPAAYNGQVTRIAQLNQIKDVLRDQPITADLGDALQNGGNALFTGDIAGSSTNIYTKIDELNFDNGNTAVADAFVQLADDFVASTVANTGTASDGTAGILDNRHFTDKGLEYAQILEKGLYGPLLFHQMAGDYLRPVQAGAENTNFTNDTQDYDEEGTARQHAWDEAFGYFGANPLTYPNAGNASTGDGDFIANYTFDFSDETEDAFGVNLAQKAMDAFIFGRAVLKAGEGTNALDESQNEAYYDAARADAIKYVEAGIAAAAFHYLNLSITDVDPADKLHHLSEALAFMYALAWSGGEGRISESEVYSALGDLGWGASNLSGVYSVDLWNVTDEQLETARQRLNESFPGFADVPF